eukprot:4809926-Pyramimonas_sp.AAC.1
MACRRSWTVRLGSPSQVGASVGRGSSSSPWVAQIRFHSRMVRSARMHGWASASGATSSCCALTFDAARAAFAPSLKAA